MLTGQQRVVGDKPLLAFRPVLRGDEHAAHGLEELQLKQVGGSACPEQERGFASLTAYLAAEVEQRGHSHAAAYEQHALRRTYRHGESVAERQHTVEGVALAEPCQTACAVAYGSHHQPQLVALPVYIVYRYGAAQKRRGRVVDTHLHKLAGQHLWERLVIGQLYEHVLGAQRLY